MTSGRIVAISILCLPLASFAQDQRSATSTSAANPSIRVPALPAVSTPKTTILAPEIPADKIALSLEGSGDSTCYAIRSYVVARDAKDSDSTHPVGYSTCRPSARYQVKTVDAPPVSLGTLDSKR